MTLQHFKAIANALAQTRPINTAPKAVRFQWCLTTRAVADACRQFNPGFNSDRFFEACGGLYY